MLSESATVMAVGPDGVWVAARSKRQCGSCQARKVCGHSLVDALYARSNQLRAYSEDEGLLRSLKVGDQVIIGVPEQLVLTGSLLLYLFPLLTMLIPAVLFSFAGAVEGVIIVAAASGFTLGLLLLRHGASRWLAPAQARLLARDTDQLQSITIRDTAPRTQ